MSFLPISAHYIYFRLKSWRITISLNLHADSYVCSHKSQISFELAVFLFLEKHYPTISLQPIGKNAPTTAPKHRYPRFSSVHKKPSMTSIMLLEVIRFLRWIWPLLPQAQYLLHVAYVFLQWCVELCLGLLTAGTILVLSMAFLPHVAGEGDGTGERSRLKKGV